MTTNKTEHKFAVGDRVKISKVHKIETLNPEMNKFLGATGTVVLLLPREWPDQFKFERYRVRFDDKTLSYTDSTGAVHHALNFFRNELSKI